MGLDTYVIRQTFNREYMRLRERADEDGVLPSNVDLRIGHAIKKLGHCQMIPDHARKPASGNGTGYRIGHIYISRRIATCAQLVDTIRHEVAHALAFLHYGKLGDGHGPLWKYFADLCGAVPEAKAPVGAIDRPKRRYFVFCEPCDKTLLAVYRRSSRWQSVARKEKRYRCTHCGNRDLSAV